MSIFTHACVGTNDIAASQAFYDAALGALGIDNLGAMGDKAFLYGLAHGGTCEGAPGPRAFAPTAYAAYMRDPTGNKICAYCYADGE